MQLAEKHRGQATLYRVHSDTKVGTEEPQNTVQEEDYRRYTVYLKWVIFDKNSCLQSIETYLRMIFSTY